MTAVNKNDVTNEELARMIAEGFANTATKQDVKGIDDRLTGVEGRIGGVEERLTIVEKKLDKALYREFERIDKLEKDMKVVKQKLGISA